MRILASLALAVAASLAFATAPAPAAVVQPPDAARSAAELAKLVHPVELAVATAAEGSDRYLVQTMLKNPDYAALEKQYPGIMEAMYRAGRPFMLQLERRSAHRIQQELATLYQAELTAGEIEAVRGFFSSATGQKIIRGMFNPEGVKDVVAVVAENPETDVEEHTLSQIQAQSAERMAATATADDEKVAAAFLISPVGAKLQKLTPRMQAMIAQIVNERDPELQSQIEGAMEGAARRFVEAAKK